MLVFELMCDICAIVYLSNVHAMLCPGVDRDRLAV